MPNNEYKRLDDNGLIYLLQLLKNKIDNSGEANVIETVKVNGTALVPDANKAVDVAVPTAGSAQNPNGYASYGDYEGISGLIPDNASAQNKLATSEDLVSFPEYTVEISAGPNNVLAGECTLGDSKNGTFPAEHGFSMGFVDNNGTEEVSAYWFYVNERDEQLEKTIQLATKNYVNSTFRTEAQVQTAINNAIAGISGIEYQVVQSLPATGEKGVIYLLANSGTAPNVYDEYIWIEDPDMPGGEFEKIGTTAVDLSGYVQASEMHALTNAEIDAIFDQVWT